MCKPDLPTGFALVCLASIDSTSMEAKRRCAIEPIDGLVIQAERQTAGRGRGERVWLSPPGNLYASIVARPRVPLARAAQMAFVAALATADAVAASLPIGCQVRCKWPNDVLVDGRKIAGILLESASAPDGALAWLVVGIGVNVARHPEGAELLYPATSLAAAGAGDVTPAGVLAALVAAFARWRARWEADGFAPIRRAWIARAAGLGGDVVVRTQTGSCAGRFVDLADDGAMRIETTDGVRAVMAGDVFLAAGG